MNSWRASLVFFWFSAVLFDSFSFEFCRRVWVVRLLSFDDFVLQFCSFCWISVGCFLFLVFVNVLLIVSCSLANLFRVHWLHFLIPKIILNQNSQLNTAKSPNLIHHPHVD
jgi:hypothetical protein